MITEDYVSFETAKLLKEKGFNKDTYTTYMYDENGEAKDVLLLKVGEEPVLRPTLQMAMKWLREEKQILISIMFCDYPALQKTEWIPEVCTHDSAFDEPSIAYPTYEEACESAIKYCLENLV